MFDYNNEKKEHIRCNQCRSDTFFILATRSRNNLDAQTCLCKTCGLIYISPRMTKEGYDAYYLDHYRNDRAAIKGTREDDELNYLFETSRRHGNGLARLIKEYIKDGLTVDVGSSTGGLLAGMRDVVPGIIPFGVEPSRAESEVAERHGIPTEVSLFENLPAEKVSMNAAQTIICAQSLNHLLDPRLFFEWSYDRLKPGGHLILVVKNWRHQVRRAGKLEAGVQIDHVFMFTPEVLANFVQAVGFEVVYLDNDEHRSSVSAAARRKEGLPVHHVRIVARKPEKAPEKSSPVKKRRLLYWKLRFQLFRPYLYLYYVLAYSKRLSRLRKPFVS